MPELAERKLSMKSNSPTSHKKNAGKAKTNSRQEQADCYRDPVRLLKTYRDVRWNLKLSMEYHKQDFEEEYGMSITEYLDTV